MGLGTLVGGAGGAIGDAMPSSMPLSPPALDGAEETMPPDDDDDEGAALFAHGAGFALVGAEAICDG
jgi:hypothetical protein